MSAVLLDANVLIALAWPQHVHHDVAHRWFESNSRGPWATCELTQLAFVRISSNPAIIPEATSAVGALAVLREIVNQPGHVYWEGGPAPSESVALGAVAVVGHRQTTDAWLLELTRHHDGRLVTLDRAMPAFARAIDKDIARRVLLID